jgi:hypothetical protein
MPGPSNKKKQKGKAKQKSSAVVEVVERTVGSPIARTVEAAMFEAPFIHDPGNGPRVRDVKMFLESRFAQPVAQDDELCREFGQKEVLEMLMTVLPEDMALVGVNCIEEYILMVGTQILWYNKSRAKSRICPACLGLYNVGELTRGGTDDKVVLSARVREQELSGFCGWMILEMENGMDNSCIRFSDVLRCCVSGERMGNQRGVGAERTRDEGLGVGGAEQRRVWGKCVAARAGTDCEDDADG